MLRNAGVDPIAVPQTACSPSSVAVYGVGISAAAQTQLARKVVARVLTSSEAPRSLPTLLVYLCAA